MKYAAVKDPKSRDSFQKVENYAHMFRLYFHVLA